MERLCNTICERELSLSSGELKPCYVARAVYSTRGPRQPVDLSASTSTFEEKAGPPRRAEALRNAASDGKCTQVADVVSGRGLTRS